MTNSIASIANIYPSVTINYKAAKGLEPMPKARNNAGITAKQLTSMFKAQNLGRPKPARRRICISMKQIDKEDSKQSTRDIVAERLHTTKNGSLACDQR